MFDRVKVLFNKPEGIGRMVNWRLDFIVNTFFWGIVSTIGF